VLCFESYLTPLATIYRTRLLPAPGSILRRVGDHVASSTVVAEADVSMGYRLLDMEQMLGVRVHDVRRVLVKRRGETIEQGEVIARAGILVKTECVSPVTGQIMDVHGNKVLIEVAPQHIGLAAFYPGKIVNVLSNRGVMIEVTGALIQGMWGRGEELRARLERAAPDGDTPLQPHMVSASHIGTILIGGRILDAEAVSTVVENKVHAVIVGSIHSDILPVIEAAPLSIILTEGFGDIAMNPHTFELLSSYVGREACFSPITKTRWENRRPEIVVPLRAEGEPPVAEYGAPLEVGTRVRVLRAPYQGNVGQVMSLPPHRHLIESGIKVRGAEVDLESVGKAFIPFENLEIVR
jgi:hypothetical protein